MKNWYTITNKGDAGPAEISIFGPIGNTWDGEGVTASKFIKDFKAIKSQDVTITVNSPGGSLFDGLAIYTAMASSGKTITAKVMGLAASAASLIVMAASKITMPKNTHLMVHKAGNGVWGNADDMRKMAEVMDSLDQSIAATYAARTGKSIEDIKAMLDSGDTWLTADQAVEMGFADEATELVMATAMFDIDSLPEAVRASLQPPPVVVLPAPVIPTAATALADDIQALATSAGLGTLASVFALDPAVTDLPTAQLAIDAAKSIQAYAKLAGQEDRADPLIRARKTVAEARAVLASNQARVDESTYIDTAPKAKPIAAADNFSVSGLWNDIKAMQAGSKK